MRLGHGSVLHHRRHCDHGRQLRRLGRRRVYLRGGSGVRGCCLRLAGQHHLRPLMMLSMSMSVIAKSKLSFVYHCLLLLHLPLFLCRTCSAAQRRPPAARSARRSPSHFLVLSSTLQSTRPSARGSSEACSGLATTEQTARSVCTPMLFCTFSFSSSRISSAARARSLHRTEPSTSAANDNPSATVAVSPCWLAWCLRWLLLRG